MFLNGKLYIVKMLLPSQELQRFETFLTESLFTSGTPLVSKGQCAITQRLKLAVNKFGNPRKDPFAASGDSAQNPALFTYTLWTACGEGHVARNGRQSLGAEWLLVKRQQENREGLKPAKWSLVVSLEKNSRPWMTSTVPTGTLISAQWDPKRKTQLTHVQNPYTQKLWDKFVLFSPKLHNKT